MHTRTVEQVRTWDSRPFSGGLGTLSELAATDHTGAVVADDTWLFMLNGRVIGIFEGTMDDFEASGTIYTTPNDSLPLLFAMQEREGRTRAKYFTEDTPLEEADRTLADANFTGYVELSENVLSGDYYLVYYGGTRRSVAFIGQSERVETGDAAFEKAADEVGIYEVLDVSMTITEIPEPQTAPSGAAVAGAEVGDGSSAEADPDPTAEADPESEPADASAAGAKAGGEASETEATEPGDAEPDASEAPEPGSATPDAPEAIESGDAEPDESAVDAAETEAAEPAADSTSSPGEADSVTASTADAIESAETPASGRKTGPADATEPPSHRGSSAEETPSAGRETQTDATTAGESAGSRAEETAAGETGRSDEADSELEQMFRAEEQWRRSNAIPALDPDETEPTDAEREGAGAAGTSAKKLGQARSGTPVRNETASGSAGGGEHTSRTPPGTVESHSPSDRAVTGGGRRSGTPPSTPREQVEAELEKRKDRIDDLENRLGAIEQERSELAGELEDERAARSNLEEELSALRAERDELQSRVDELEGRLAGDGSAVDSGATTLSPADALAGTNLFVRYDSKSNPTLEALGPEVDPDAVNANLTLEHHTQFETADVQVDGNPYREFLEGTGEFRFVSWVLRELPYELLETGNRNALGDLFEAISAIDRVEFDGTVTVDPESGAERRFALVMRDRMGNPLVLGEYNDDRNPVRDEELETLLDGAREVAGSVDSLAGAFYVTASFFEPQALERAENAASSGGLFSRQEKASFVTPESGTGFHLGLVEDRSQAFHVTVPKL
ncbi:MAG: DUF7527 domain-containing protein [Halodesulfurarchaeum sp.]